MKRYLALVLAVSLFLALAACGASGKPDSDPAATEEPAVVKMTIPETQTDPQLLPDNQVDATEQILGFPNSTVLLTVNGVEVTAEEYLYWLGNMTAYYSQLYYYRTYGATLDLSEEISDGITWDAQLKEIAYENCVLLAITPALAQEMGVSLSQEAAEERARDHAQAVEETGREVYAYQLQAMNINDRTSYLMDLTNGLFDLVQEEWMARIQAELTAEDVARYVQEQDLLRAKHILLLTKNPMTGEEYDEDQKAAQKAKAEDILAQLKAGADFDTLMNENSEDTGLATNPDGYVFTAGEMVPEFESGTRALEYGEFSSELVESSYGYHIILRLDPDTEEVRAEVAEERFNDEVQERVDNAVVVKAPEYDTFTTADYYDQLLVFRDGLTDPTTEPAPEPAPDVP